MPKFLTFLFLLFVGFPALATIRVAVIDSGLNDYENVIPLCDSKLNRNFTLGSSNDVLGHGTNVSFLIDKEIKNKNNYCQIIIKVFHDGPSSIEVMTEGIFYAVNLNVDIINISAGAVGDPQFFEGQAIRMALDKNIVVVASAGNEATDLNVKCNFYPACYDSRVIVIGNDSASSNWGDKHVDIFENGMDQDGGGYVKSGTSQAAARVTGKLINSTDRFVTESLSNEQSYEKAFNYTNKALYRQFEIEKILAGKLERFNKCIPEDYRFILGHIYKIAEIAHKQRIEYIYEF